MREILIDTNVLSELTKPSPSPKVEAFLRQTADHVYLSVLSVGEVRKGIAGLAPGRRREELSLWLDREILPWLGKRLLPVTLEIAERWGDLAATLRAEGKPRPIIDALIAATAAHHGLVIATRNISDYRGMGVEVLNPWE